MMGTIDEDIKKINVFSFIFWFIIFFSYLSHCLQARERIIRILSQLLEERRAFHETHLDMLGCLMKKEDNRYILRDEEIIDLIITIMYSGYETVSTTSMMAVKYLHDHPNVLKELRVSEKSWKDWSPTCLYKEAYHVCFLLFSCCSDSAVKCVF